MKLLPLLAVATLASAATQTIASLAAYQSQRSCAIPCFWNGDPDNSYASDTLAIKLECCTDRVSCRDRAQDSCFCRADLRPVAASWLSTCVNGYCSSNAVDVVSAVAVYDEYCVGKRVDGPAPAPTPTGSQTGAGTGAKTGGAAATATGSGSSSGCDGLRQGIPWWSGLVSLHACCYKPPPTKMINTNGFG